MEQIQARSRLRPQHAPLAAKIPSHSSSHSGTPLLHSTESPRSISQEVQAAAVKASLRKASAPIRWQKHTMKSCQNYANDDHTARSLEDSKSACMANHECVAVECPHGQEDGCTLRAVANKVDWNG